MIVVSFQITPKLAPFSMMALMIMINHFAGMMLLISWSGIGILEIGNINPESKITGNMSPNSEIIIAVCCESDRIEIKIPSDKAQIINKMVSNANKNKLPSMGISKTK